MTKETLIKLNNKFVAEHKNYAQGFLNSDYALNKAHSKFMEMVEFKDDWDVNNQFVINKIRNLNN